MAIYLVAVYDSSLAWGGPEEGGWWYDAGSLARIVRLFRNADQAYLYARRLNKKLESRTYGPNQGKREKSSVISDGVYEAHVCQDHVPQFYPAERPHYE